MERPEAVGRGAQIQDAVLRELKWDTRIQTAGTPGWTNTELT